MTDLSADFPAGTIASWRSSALEALRKRGRADQDMTAEQVQELLTTVSHDGVRTLPLYTPADALPLPGRPGYFPFVRGGRRPWAAVRGWDVRQRHADPDVAATRAAIRDDVDNGVTSLWVVAGEAGVPPAALPGILAGLDPGRTAVVLDAGEQALAAAETWLELAPAGMSGGLGLDPFGEHARTGRQPRGELAATAALAVRCAAERPGIRAFTIDGSVHHDAGAGDAEEVGGTVAAGVAVLRALTAAGLDLPAAFAQLEFRYAATADQFATIAKFRAARLLWARVAQECGVPQAGAQHQHAVTSAAMMTTRDPWSNIVRTTVAAFAAGVAGAGAITVQPFDHALGLPDRESRRLARNTHAVLAEEAGAARVADPGGGSWYLEQLTRGVAEAAWSWFTEIERAGGMAAALDRGLVAARLAATRGRRTEAVARRRDVIVGVSEFASLTENRPRRRPAPVRSGGGLARNRHAEAFEALRDRVDAHTALTGGRPTVFLAAWGPLAEHAARSEFTAGLLAAGGVATTSAGAVDDPDALADAFAVTGLTVACLCAGDARYAEDAERLAKALSAVGARRIWLAGRPAGITGVDDYLYAGCDAVTVLTILLRDLEVA